MYYLYHNRDLKPLPLNPSDAIGIAKFCDGILVTNKIEEAVLIASYSKAALLLHTKNLSSLFRYWKLQIKHKTLKEFHIIIYAGPKNILYHFLKWVAWSSMGSYHLIDFFKTRRDIA